MELSLLTEWQGWAEQAIARLEGRDRNSRHGMAASASDLAQEFRLLSGLFLYSSWTTDIHRALDRRAKPEGGLENPGSRRLGVPATLCRALILILPVYLALEDCPGQSDTSRN